MSDAAVAYGDGDPIRNKLLLGDADTRKINRIMEDYVKLTTTTDAAERDSLLDKINNAISAVELGLFRPWWAVTMHAQEKQMYKSKRDVVTARIEQSKLAVEKAKGMLTEARAKRRRQEEYDALAAVALKRPSIEESKKNIEGVRAQVAELKSEGAKLDSKFELRRRQFHLLLHTANDIRSMLLADGELAEEDEDEITDEIVPTQSQSTEPARKLDPTADPFIPMAVAPAPDDRRPAMYGADASNGSEVDSAAGKTAAPLPAVAATAGAADTAVATNLVADDEPAAMDTAE